MRYSRSGPDVTLFLRDRAAATQDLVLVGSMSIEVGRETKLPGVDVIGATVSDARLLLEPGPQVDMAVINAPSPSAVSREDRDEDRASRRSREYLLVPDAPLPSVRVTARNEPPHVDSVTVLTPAGSHSVDVDVYLRMTGTQGEQGPFENLDSVRGCAAVDDYVECRQASPPACRRFDRRAPAGATGNRSGCGNSLEPDAGRRYLADSDTFRVERADEPACALDRKRARLEASFGFGHRRAIDAGAEWIRRRLPEGQSLSGWQLAEPDANSWVLHRASNRIEPGRRGAGLC